MLPWAEGIDAHPWLHWHHFLQLAVFDADSDVADSAAAAVDDAVAVAAGIAATHVVITKHQINCINSENQVYS